MQDLKLLHDAVLNGDAKTAKAMTEKALAAGVEPLKLVQDYMVPAMAEVGERRVRTPPRRSSQWATCPP